MFEIEFNIETTVILPMAVSLDMIPWVFLFFGLPDFGISAILGNVFMNTWMLIRGSKKKKDGGQINFIEVMKKMMTDPKYKFISVVFIKIIPYLNNLPLYTIQAILELQNSKTETNETPTPA